jgi:hypothetical protein
VQTATEYLHFAQLTSLPADTTPAVIPCRTCFLNLNILSRPDLHRKQAVYKEKDDAQPDFFHALSLNYAFPARGNSQE